MEEMNKRNGNTSFNTDILHAICDNTDLYLYRINFETDNIDYYEHIQNECRKCVDKKVSDDNVFQKLFEMLKEKMYVCPNFFEMRACSEKAWKECLHRSWSKYFNGRECVMEDYSKMFDLWFQAEQKLKELKEERIIQTNRQWLESLSDEEFIDWLMNDYENLKYSFRSTRSGMIEWLQEEHID